MVQSCRSLEYPCAGAGQVWVEGLPATQERLDLRCRVSAFGEQCEGSQREDCGALRMMLVALAELIQDADLRSHWLGGFRVQGQ